MAKQWQYFQQLLASGLEVEQLKSLQSILLQTIQYQHNWQYRHGNYTGSITEWIAENFNWYWNNGTPYTTSATVANRTNLTNFMRSIGAWEGAVGATTAPSPMTGLAAVSTFGGAVRLTWTPPSSTDYSRPVIRRAVGATAPTSPTDGTSVPIVVNPTTGAVLGYTWDAGLIPGTTYSYAVFARNYAGNHSTAATVTVTTAA